jgi:hypothetical protein
MAIATGEPTSLDLATPIDAHGESLSKLTFRPLTVEDFDRVGYPMRLGSDGMEPIADRVSALISRLANVPRSSVSQMSIADWHNAMAVILGFFGVTVPTS